MDESSQLNGGRATVLLATPLTYTPENVALARYLVELVDAGVIRVVVPPDKLTLSTKFFTSDNNGVASHDFVELIHSHHIKAKVVPCTSYRQFFTKVNKELHPDEKGIVLFGTAIAVKRQKFFPDDFRIDAKDAADTSHKLSLPNTRRGISRARVYFEAWVPVTPRIPRKCLRLNHRTLVQPGSDIFLRQIDRVVADVTSRVPKACLKNDYTRRKRILRRRWPVLRDDFERDFIPTDRWGFRTKSSITESELKAELSDVVRGAAITAHEQLMSENIDANEEVVTYVTNASTTGSSSTSTMLETFCETLRSCIGDRKLPAPKSCELSSDGISPISRGAPVTQLHRSLSSIPNAPGLQHDGASVTHLQRGNDATVYR